MLHGASISCSFDGMAEVKDHHLHLKLQKQFIKLELAPVMGLDKAERSSTCSRGWYVF